MFSFHAFYPPRARAAAFAALFLASALDAVVLAQPPRDAVSDGVGASYGEFRVDEAGQSTYTLPLFVPPGTAGVEPKLSLSYNSGGGNGPLGKGWSIGGQSAITRCRKTREHGDFMVDGAPVDGNPLPVTFTREDAFCLDGQRLLRVSGGQDGDPGAEYRLELDPFTRVTSVAGNNGAGVGYTGPDHFIVRRRDGSTSEYGHSADSRIEAAQCAGAVCQPTAVAAAWAQNRFEDSTGNYILYEYSEKPFSYLPFSGNDYYLKKVKYTGKRQLPGQTAPASPPYAEIEFVHQPIVAPNGQEGENGFLGNARFSLTQYLHSIVVRDQIDGSPRVLRFYKLTYSTSASGSRMRLLRSVKECRDSSEAVCYRPTEFRWSDEDGVAYRFDTQDAFTTVGTGVRVGALRYGDVDGDGRMDVVWFRRDDPACPGTNRLRVGFGDRVEGGGQSRLTLVTPDHANFCTSLNAGNNALAGGIGLMDFDGDGRDDLIISDPSTLPNGRWHIYRSLGRPAANAPVFDTNADLMNVVIPSATSANQAQFGDFNGDGLIDMIYPTGSESLAIRFLTRKNPAPPPGQNAYEFGPAYTLTNFLPVDCNGASCNLEIFQQTTAAFGVAGDFNGDGRGDLVLRVTLSDLIVNGVEKPPVTFHATDRLADEHPELVQGFESQRFYAFSMGAKNDAAKTQAVSQYGVALYVRNDLGPQDPRHFQFADFNGDGLSDLFYTTDAASENFRFALSTGSTFQGPAGNVFTGQIRNVKNREHVRLADIDGDGRTEVLYPTDTGTPCPGSASGDRVFRYRRFSTVWNGMENPQSNNPHIDAPCVPGGGAKAGDLADAQYLFADFDGDGAVDFIKLRDRLGTVNGQAQPQLFTSRAGTASRFKRRDAIARITDGNGAVTEIAYQPQTNKAIYRRLKHSRNDRVDGRGSPVMDLLSAEYVVSQVSSSAPTLTNANAMSTLWYRYAGGRAQAGGRGFLGYQEIDTFDVNPVAGKHTATQQYYRQDFPFIGASAQTAKYVLPGAPTRGSAELDACAGNPEALGRDCFYDPAAVNDAEHPPFGAFGAVLVQAGASLWSCQGNGGAEVCSPAPPTDSCPAFELGVIEGLPLLVELAAPVGVFGESALAIRETIAAQQPIFPYVPRTVDLDFSFETGAVTRHVCGLFAYGDARGNVTQSTVATFNGGALNTEVARKRTFNVYVNDTANWRLGRLMSSLVEDTRGGVVRSRVTDFDYEVDRPGYASPTDTGLLKGEWLQKGVAGNQELRTLYTLDAYGNRTGEFTCSRHQPDGTLLSDAQCRDPSAVTQRPVDGNAPVAAVHRYALHSYSGNGRYRVSTRVPYFGAGPGNVNEKPSVTINAHDEFGHPVSQTDANGLTATALYGALGRPYYAADATGRSATTTFRWCGAGPDEVPCPQGMRFRRQTLTAGAPSAFGYHDALGREVITVRQAFNAGVAGQHWTALCTNHDSHGRAVATTIPFFLSAAAGTGAAPNFAANATPCAGIATTQTAFDPLGRPTKTTAPDGSATTVAYLDRTTTTTDARGRQTRQTKNALGEVLTIVQADAVSGSVDGGGALTVTHEYDAQGNLRFVRRNAGTGEIATERQYDALGRLTRLIDPDRGITDYDYNAAGEPIVQQDARGQRIEQDWDALGRRWRRRSGAGVAFGGPWDRIFGNGFELGKGDGEIAVDEWRYDTASKGLGSLALESRSAASGQFTRSYSYDTYGRPSGRQTGFDGSSYSEATTYDSVGRVATVKDASGDTTTHAYTGHGYPNALRYSRAGVGLGDGTFHEIQAQDAWGQVTQERRGGLIATSRSYHPTRGWIETVDTGAAQQWSYAFDANGNLSQRNRGGSLIETLSYDKLDRLTTIQRSGSATVAQTTTQTYDKLGNLCGKGPNGAVQTYSYAGRAGCPGSGGQASARPHAVTAVDTTSYLYDASGLMVQANAPGTANDRHLEFDALEQAVSLKRGSAQSPTAQAQFAYAPDGSRYRRIDRSNGAIVRTTRYVGNVEIVIEGGVTRTIRYLGGNAIVTTVSNQPNTVQDRYALPDHLGSVDVIVNDAGQVVESTSFDAWGSRRGAANWQGPGSPLQTTTHGYTGHEHVDAIGLIHMNGRIYDPALARFVQADPLLDAGVQGMNRYSYVLNNPLSLTDPSGHLSTHQWGQVFMTAVMAIGTAGASLGLSEGVTLSSAMGTSGQIVFSAGMGSIAGMTQSQTLKGAAWGAFSGLAFWGIGSYFDGAQWAQAAGGQGAMGTNLTLGGYASKVLAHGIAGGTMSSLQGGRFGSGFAAAGVTQAFSGSIERIDAANPVVGSAARVTAAAIVGGTASKLTGGKFANGALTAAFARAFNDELHRSKTSSSYSAEDPRYHEYRIGPTDLCEFGANGCTFPNALDVVNNVSVPFMTNPQEGRLVLPPFADPIFHVVDRSNYRIYNITDEGHTFHPGQVEHSLSISSKRVFDVQTLSYVNRQYISLTTVGTGYGPTPAFNNFVGRQLFGFTHLKAQIEMRRQGGGN